MGGEGEVRGVSDSGMRDEVEERVWKGRQKGKGSRGKNTE